VFTDEVKCNCHFLAPGSNCMTQNQALTVVATKLNHRTVQLCLTLRQVLIMVLWVCVCVCVRLCAYVHVRVCMHAWIAQSVWCPAMDWMTGRLRFDPWQGHEDFSSKLCIWFSSGAHPASCPVGTRGLFPRDKAWPGRDTDHLSPSSAEVVNE
jgi:hypothetical protein